MKITVESPRPLKRYGIKPGADLLEE